MDFLCFKTEMPRALKWVGWVGLCVCGQREAEWERRRVGDVVGQEEIVGNEILDS